MHIIDGIAYADANLHELKIESVKHLRDTLMLVSFNNGDTKVFDASLLEGEVFEPLKNIEELKKCILDHGVPTWCDGDIDCAPDYIFDNSMEYDAT